MKVLPPALRQALRDCNVSDELQNTRAQLEFSRPLEAAYREDTADWRRRHYSHSAVITLICYNSFLLLDFIVVPDVFTLSVVLHLALVTPVILLATLLIRSSTSWRRTELLAALMPLVILAQIEAVFLSSEAASAPHYQYLVLFPTMFSNAVLKLPFRFATGVSLISMVTHGIVVMGFSNPGVPAAVMGTMTMVGATYATLMAGAIHESGFRRSWLRNRMTELRAGELSEDNAKLDHLARIDPLTGAANRRGFDQAIGSILQDTSASAMPYCVIMMDVDRFKSFNDTYGHAAGDHCLRTLSGVLMNGLRLGRDVLARFGGEEFIVFVPNSTLDEALLLADHLRRSVAAAAIPHHREDGGHVVTASFGVAEGITNGERSFSEVVAQADAALYEAKQQGRNRVQPLPPRRRSASANLLRGQEQPGHTTREVG